MITAAIVFLAAIIGMIGSARLLSATRQIKKTGIAVEGVIFALEDGPNNSGSTDNFAGRQARFPVVRFVTEEQKWITKAAKIGTTAYKPGTIVRVVYQKDDPERFFIDDLTNRILPVLFFVLSGLLGIAAAIYLIWNCYGHAMAGGIQ